MKMSRDKKLLVSYDRILGVEERQRGVTSKVKEDSIVHQNLPDFLGCLVTISLENILYVVEYFFSLAVAKVLRVVRLPFVKVFSKDSTEIRQIVSNRRDNDIRYGQLFEWHEWAGRDCCEWGSRNCCLAWGGAGARAVIDYNTSGSTAGRYGSADNNRCTGLYCTFNAGRAFFWHCR